MESAMNGGHGTYSYSKNSEYQRMTAETVKEEIEAAIFKNLDVKALSSDSNKIRVADLGCSTGPNTFIAMKNLVEGIQKKHASQCPNSESPEFQVFFNDKTTNDFNTLFTSLPADRPYFAAGVPGTFHNQLFPKSSLHFVYSCHALHIISKIPEELLDKNSPAWNKGNCFYLTAPKEVYNAYRSQYHKDVDNFLSLRAKEIVSGGMLVILVSGLPRGTDSHLTVSCTNLTFDLIGSTLMDMAREGIISESLVDSYNLPLYSLSVEEMIEVVEKNGHFSTEKVEFTLMAFKGEVSEISKWLNQSRAGLEGQLSEHFGNQYIDEIFERLDVKLRERSELLASSMKASGQLFVVLKRK